MKIGILSRKASLYSTTRLREATEDRGHQVSVIDFLNVAGVDLLRSERGPLVLEVNSSPGLEGIEITTGVDVASEIIEFVENQVHSDHE